jgi:hypothetical protein
MRQHTEIPMQPIEDDEARELGRTLSDIGIGDDDRKNLIRLVCGIAAIDNPVTRQEVAAEAVYSIYLNLEHIFNEVGGYVARVYEEAQKGGGA